MPRAARWAICLIGVTRGEASKWLHQWSEIAVRYVDGRMEYVLRDPAFEGLAIKLSAAPLAHSVGLIVKVDVAGEIAGKPTITWAYGGASGFFSNYDMGAKQWTFAPDTMREGPHSRRLRWF